MCQLVKYALILMEVVFITRCYKGGKEGFLVEPPKRYIKGYQVPFLYTNLYCDKMWFVLTILD